MPPTLIAMTREVLRLMNCNRVYLNFGVVYIIEMPKTVDMIYDSVIDFDLIEPDLEAEEMCVENLDKLVVVGKRHKNICWFERQ